MRSKMIFLSLVIPFFSLAQNENKNNPDSGIRFEHCSWTEVLNKARSENKPIFLDCYASWCGPCKSMDKNVYPLKSVGDFFNEKFISVKLQMDSTLQDNEDVKNLYADARRIMRQYKIKGFPTLIFFSASGEPYFQVSSGFDADGLISTAKYALDPNYQYSSLLKRYQDGERDSVLMINLVSSLKSFKEDSLAEKIANDYIDKLDENKLYAPGTLNFIRDYTHSSKVRGFGLFYHHSKEVDEIMGQKGFAQDQVDYVITHEEIFTPSLIIASKDVKELDWNKMRMVISSKYNPDYADRVVLHAKVGWYGFKENWSEYCKNQVLCIQKYDTAFSSYFLNDCAWTFFQHSTDKKYLGIAVSWCKKVLEKDHADGVTMDTYANLLYKMGKRVEAISIEQKAVALIPDDKESQDNLEKIKKGIPTW